MTTSVKVELVGSHGSAAVKVIGPVWRPGANGQGEVVHGAVTNTVVLDAENPGPYWFSLYDHSKLEIEETR